MGGQAHGERDGGGELGNTKQKADCQLRTLPTPIIGFIPTIFSSQQQSPNSQKKINQLQQYLNII